MNLEEYVNTFKQNVGSAIKCIENAAICYANACREYPNEAQAKFEEAYPHVTPNTWRKFLAVGNGDLNPAALILSDMFCAKISRMPRSVQDEALNGDSFTVFNPTTRKVDKINYGCVKTRHEKILFDDSRNVIRTIPEQIAYCNLVAAEKKSSEKRYTVHTDRLEVHCACEIGRGELEGILSEME